MGNQMPEEPDLQEAFIKSDFLSKGIKPQDVDELDVGLINNLREIQVQKVNVKEIKDNQRKVMEANSHGRTTNQSPFSSRYEQSGQH